MKKEDFDRKKESGERLVKDDPEGYNFSIGDVAEVE